MQYLFIGFGMLESGCVSIKNEVNIMMKNVVDIVVGGRHDHLGGTGSLQLTGLVNCRSFFKD